MRSHFDCEAVGLIPNRVKSRVTLCLVLLQVKTTEEGAGRDRDQAILTFTGGTEENVIILRSQDLSNASQTSFLIVKPRSREAREQAFS